MVKVNGKELLFYKNNQLRIRALGYNQGEEDVGYINDFELKPPFSHGYSETGHLVLTDFSDKANSNPRLIHLGKTMEIRAAAIKDLSSILDDSLSSEDVKTAVFEAIKILIQKKD